MMVTSRITSLRFTRSLATARRINLLQQPKRRVKIVRTDCEQTVPALDAALDAVADELILLPEDGTTESQLADACADADLVLHCYTPVTRGVVERATKLRAVVKYGVGIDKIDIEACCDHGVAVANIPEYGEETVAGLAAQRLR